LPGLRLAKKKALEYRRSRFFKNRNKKMKKLILSILLFGLAGLSTKATTITWHDLDTLGVSLAPGKSYTNTFNIAVGGDDGDGQNSANKYNPLLHTITGAEVAFDFVRTYPTGLAKLNKFSYTLDGADLHSGSTTLGTFAIGDSVNVLFDLQLDGVLKYVIKNTGTLTTFRLDSARLDAEGQSQSVPDGGSAAVLLGGSFFGIASLSKKRRANGSQ
jgi:hypothetical protein